MAPISRRTFRQNVFQWPYTAFEEVRRFYERTGQEDMEALIASEMERHLRIEEKLREEYHANGTRTGGEGWIG